MTKAKENAIDTATPPSHVKLDGKASSIDLCSRVRVVDAATGELIVKVVEADADQGKVIRFAVEDGGLVREGNRFKMIEEDRAIRIEWADAGEVSF